MEAAADRLGPAPADGAGRAPGASALGDPQRPQDRVPALAGVGLYAVASRMLSLQLPILVGIGRTHKSTTESSGLAGSERVSGYGEMAGQEAVFRSGC